jgi:hypothetical protein
LWVGGANYAIEAVNALDSMLYTIGLPEALFGAVALAEVLVRRVYGRR